MTICAFVLTAALLASATGSPALSKSLDNLQTAFNGESNAHARYLEFARRADAEGYAPVASLFRAAARAEQIHAQNHAAVIRKLGGTPTSKLEKVVTRSTSDNLKAAIQGETYEKDTMYPEFLKEARNSGNTDVLQTLNYAKSAEVEHAKLYQEALSKLPQLKGKAVSYYVCTVCGFTTMKLDFSKCPSCFNPKEKYVQVG
jgi:rubrerythrin